MTTIDLKDAEKHFEEAGERMLKAAIKGLHSAASSSVQVITTRIVPSLTRQPVDRGLYRAGWRAIAEKDGATIENNEPHAAFIEYGVRGSHVKIGARMIVALTEWVTRKGLASGKEAVRAAWAIAKSMQRRGIFNGGSGLQILYTLEQKYLSNIVEEEVAREIEKVL